MYCSPPKILSLSSQFSTALAVPWAALISIEGGVMSYVKAIPVVLSVLLDTLSDKYILFN